MYNNEVSDKTIIQVLEEVGLKDKVLSLKILFIHQLEKVAKCYLVAK